MKSCIFQRWTVSIIIEVKVEVGSGVFMPLKKELMILLVEGQSSITTICDITLASV